MEPVSSRCAKILLYLKISIKWGSVLLRRTFPFRTESASLRHLHYNSVNTNTRMHTQRKSPHLQLPEPFGVTTAVCLMLLQCSVRSVAIEFVPLKRIWNLNLAGLREAAVTCMTATITPRINLSHILRLTVITKGTQRPIFMVCLDLIPTCV